MTSCTHMQLVLLPKPKDRLRCQYCHLTLNADELSSGYCPECYESSHQKRFDFDAIAAVETGIVQYRCEDCGAMIENR